MLVPGNIACKSSLRQDWEDVKDDIMLEALRAKFTQHNELKELLLSTGDAALVEHTFNDSYWGDGGDGSGRNMLGTLLCQVREELKELSGSNVKAETLSKSCTESNSQGRDDPVRQIDYVCVLDFEATCQEGKRLNPQEVIEFPSVLIHVATNTILGETFQVCKVWMDGMNHPTSPQSFSATFARYIILD